MPDQMSYSLRRILYGLALLAAGQSGWAFQQRRGFDLISGSEMSSRYIDAILGQSKAAEISSFMNENADPCNNFYEFACGNWPRINKADAIHVSTGLLERMNEAVNRKIKKFLNKEDTMRDTEEDKQVRDFYKSCTRVTSIDKEYQDELRSLIKVFGSMPVLEGDKWNASNFDWLNTTAAISFYYGLNIIVGTEVQKDLMDNKVNIVYIVAQDFALQTRSMYQEEHTETYRKTYQDYMAQILQIYLGVETELAQKTASELMDLEVQLANGILSGSQLIQISKKTTLDEMQSKYAPDLNVKHLVEITMKKLVENVFDFNPHYKTNLIKVVKKTSKRILANYIFFKLIAKFTLPMDKSTKMPDCFAETQKYFSKNLDNMIYRRYNNEATASDIELIWSELKETFKQQLLSDRSLNWISNTTREKAVEKLATMRLQVSSYANEDLSKDFRDMHLQNESYISNLKNVFEVKTNRARQLLSQPVKPVDNFPSFTPMYYPPENVINVPVALLQPYFLWASSYPNAIKFSTLGFFIGHELIHGFDSQGRKFDAVGNINNWWDEESTANFLNRRSCFTDQYSKYSYNGRLLPPSKDQSENIADNGGLRVAYTAYRRWQDAQKTSGVNVNEAGKNKLPKLNYTNTQLFFISYAQVWCNDVEPTLRSSQVETDEHVPGEYRVIGPLSNFDEFAKDFQCELGTPMNPATKCKLY
ncbi:neprilysin-1-like [Drosophila innubila]|uniref:neprilysin-1-like n=1 Tax=Drosophila innubila TaxID=198719 RepID=UPI00148B6002|nr:neprilysin-1-like [Drosophila innubila]